MRDFVVIGLVVWAGAFAGCGPSLRLEEQSAAYFEHCHAAERDPSASDEERAACWEAWIARWSGSSTRARKAHAEARLAALTSGGEAPAASDIQPDEDEAVQDEAAAPSAPGASRSTDYPRQLGSGACDGLCLPAFDRCRAACPEQRSRECRAACEAERRVCQLACP